MKSVSHIVWVETVVVVFAALQAHDLVSAWLHSPYDRTGSVAFLLWVVPAAQMLWHYRGRGPTNRIMILTALVIALTGGICGLNFLNYAALALAFAGRWPMRGAKEAVWLALSLAWMPVLGILGAHASLPVWVVDVTRLLLGLAAALLGRRGNNQPENQP
jgi:hypothetical protein